jgi:serine/threonine protein kinase
MSATSLKVRGVPYRIVEEIGHGLHSIVYSGHDMRNGRPVAIKVTNFLHGTRSNRATTISRKQSFWKEIQMLLYLQPLNPFIIPVFNHDYNDQYGVIVMERGRTFRDTLIEYVLNDTLMPIKIVRRFWAQMVEAIHYMHDIGIVHGDCKPENFIQVGTDGSTLRLIDMGISFELPPDMTSLLRTAAGTPGK